MMQAGIAVGVPIYDDISLAVIPAKAGIQESGDTVVKGWQVLPNGALVVVPVVIPAVREWIEQTTGFRPSPE